MAISTNATKIANLVNPQVIGDMINAKLIDAIKFAPLAVVDTTLEGTAGNTISLPKYAYIGDAVVVAEGADIPIRQLTAGVTPVSVYKLANGGQITDEAVLSGYGNPVEEYVNQIVKSIASALDNKFVADLEANKTYFAAAGASITADDIASALTLFGEDIDGEKVLLVDADAYAVIRKSTSWLPASEIAAEILVKGAVGEIFGCQVVVTNRIKNGHAYIVKPGALALFLKRDVMVETDRDIVNKSTVITADKHCATYLLDDSKAITILKNGEKPVTPPTTTPGDETDAS